MKSITTLSQLLVALEKCSESEYKSVVTKMQIPKHEFTEYTHWSAERYTRNCIVRNDSYELILLCWEPGQETPIHCHNEQECWVYMIDGSMSEKHYEFPKEGCPEAKEYFELDDEDHSYMNDDIGLHSLHNTSGKRVMTLHLYAKPIDKCSYFNPETGAFETVELSYHSYLQKQEA